MTDRKGGRDREKDIELAIGIVASVWFSIRCRRLCPKCREVLQDASLLGLFGISAYRGEPFGHVLGEFGTWASIIVVENVLYKDKSIL